MRKLKLNHYHAKLWSLFLVFTLLDKQKYPYFILCLIIKITSYNLTHTLYAKERLEHVIYSLKKQSSHMPCSDHLKQYTPRFIFANTDN